MSQDDVDALAAWLDADVRHVGAYARAMAMMVHLGRIKALRGATDPDLSSRAPDDSFSPATGWRHGVRSQTRRRFLAAASVAVVAGAAGFAVFPGRAAATTYSTRRGEVRRVSLDDGSSMTLNTATTATVRFTDRARTVELVTGEALFEVAGDAARPFIVEAGGSRITADRTSFLVRKLDRAPIDITVKSGRVELAEAGALVPVATIASNMRAMMSDPSRAIRTEPVAAGRIDQALSWRKGMLSFEDAPLSQAIAQFARYDDTTIRLSDPGLGEETITGLYSAHDPRGFARSAAMSLGMSFSERPGEVTLSRPAKKFHHSKADRRLPMHPI